MTEDRAPGDRALPAFAGLVGFHAMVQVACLAPAVLGIALDRKAALAALLAAVVLALGFASRFAAARRDGAPGARTALPSHVSWPVRFCIATAVLWWAALWGRLWLLAFRRPTYDWDGLYYHVPAIHEWVLRGRVAWLSDFPDVPFVNYPMAVEAQGFFLHQILGADRLVDGLNLWYWPMAFLAVVVASGVLGATGAWRWLAGALLGGAPVLVAQSVTSYIDPGAGACVMAAVAATLVLVFHGGRRPGWTVVLWGASVGLVLGSKGTGVVLAPVFAAAAIGGGLWQEGWRRWRVWLRRVAIGLSIAATIGGYWYARAAYHTGNPIHPIELRLGARVLAPGWDAAAMMGGQLPDWLARFPPALRVPVAWLQLDAPIQGCAPVGGLGYIWLLAGLPAIALLSIRSLRDSSATSRREVLFAVGLALLLLAVQPAPWWARFTVWMHVLALPCLVRLLHELSSSRGRWRASLGLGALLAVLGVAVWESERTLALEAQTGRLARDATGGDTYSSTRGMFFAEMDTSEGFDRLLAAPAIARSPWGRAGTLLGGSLALPLGRRTIVLLPQDGLSEDDLDRAQEARVEWVLWDVVGAGDVPPLLRARAAEEHVYAPAPDVDFRAVRLRTRPMAVGRRRKVVGGPSEGWLLR